MADRLDDEVARVYRGYPGGCARQGRNRRPAAGRLMQERYALVCPAFPADNSPVSDYGSGVTFLSTNARIHSCRHRYIPATSFLAQRLLLRVSHAHGEEKLLGARISCRAPVRNDPRAAGFAPPPISLRRGLSTLRGFAIATPPSARPARRLRPRLRCTVRRAGCQLRLVAWEKMLPSGRFLRVPGLRFPAPGTEEQGRGTVHSYSTPAVAGGKRRGPCFCRAPLGLVVQGAARRVGYANDRPHTRI